jgi:integrase
MVYLQQEKSLKPSSLRDHRRVLAEPGQPHRRGAGRSPGLMMGRFGDRPVMEITTREVAEYLRSLDRAGTQPRSVKDRQVFSAIFSYGMREDTCHLAKNPVSATSKRREPPQAVLDFYEPDEVEAIARVAERGGHREVAKLTYDDEERRSRALEDRQDAELIRIAAFTGLRLGELLALRWGDVNLADRRLVVHRLQRPDGGSDEELAGPLPAYRRPGRFRVCAPG